MLRPGSSYPDVRPSEWQLPGLRLWPPPADDDKDHNHGANRGERCKSVILRYGQKKAQCARCGRVWVRPEKELERQDMVGSVLEEIRSIDAALEANVVQRENLRRERSKLLQRRRDLAKKLRVWDGEPVKGAVNEIQNEVGQRRRIPGAA